MRSMSSRYYFFYILFFLFIGCQNQTDPHFRPLLASSGLDDFEILNGSAAYERQGDMIIGTAAANTPNTFLATKEHYGDFELKFDVKIDEGINSGVQIRSISDTSIMNGRVHGYQVEIEDSPRGWAAGIYDEARRGWLYPVELNPSSLRTYRKNQWNHYHIIAIGDTIMTWLNDRPISRLVDNMTASGLIGFQVHSIRDSTQIGKQIRWRNIQIKTENIGKNRPDGLALIAEMLPAIDLNIDEFIIQGGAKIQKIAGAPQVHAPVETEIDPEGNMWVVELPGYMRDIDGNEEDLPDGKIVKLSDINNDGVIDRRVVHLDSLVAPRAICLAYGGLLYTSGKALYFQNLSNGAIELVDSTYVIGGNIEHQPNGLYYNLDNWIYSAKSNARYRLRDGQWIKEATTVRGQWGMDADVHGRLVYNNNSNGLRGDRVMPNTVIDNPYLEIKALLKNQLCDDQRVYPYQATAMNRGYIPGVLDDEDKLVKFSSVCSPIIYKGGDQWKNDAFVCAPEVNAVKQYDLINKNDPFAQDYRHTYSNKEFLISKEETFRPVNLINHPTGGFIITDLRKGIIQHRAYMTHYLRELIREKGMDKVESQGNLYWVKEQGDDNKSLAFWDKNISAEELVQLLDHPNGAMRLAVQKELIGSENIEIINLIINKYNDFGIWGKVHALWVFEGFGKKDVNLLPVANGRYGAEMMYHNLNYLDKIEAEGEIQFIEDNFEITKHDDLMIQFLHLNNNSELIDERKSELIRFEGNNLSYVEAALSNNFSGTSQSVVFKEVQQSIINNKQSNKQVAPSIITTQFSDNRNEGFPLYNKYCLSCHGTDGRGQDGLAPPILYSEYLDGPADKLAALILQGLHGSIHVRGVQYDMNLVMPGLKHNPDLGDEEISAIISFVNNAFSKDGRWISPEQVGKVRAQLGDRTELMTEEEVLGWKTNE